MKATAPRHILLRNTTILAKNILSEKHRINSFYDSINLCELRKEMYSGFMCLKESINRAEYRPDLKKHISFYQKEFTRLLSIQNKLLANLSKINEAKRKLKVKQTHKQFNLSF